MLGLVDATPKQIRRSPRISSLDRPHLVEPLRNPGRFKLTLSRNAVVAAETRAVLDLNHDFMLKQMTGTKLDVAKFLAPTQKDAEAPLPPAPPSAQP